MVVNSLFKFVIKISIKLVWYSQEMKLRRWRVGFRSQDWDYSWPRRRSMRLRLSVLRSTAISARLQF